MHRRSAGPHRIQSSSRLRAEFSIQVIDEVAPSQSDASIRPGVASRAFPETFLGAAVAAHSKSEPPGLCGTNSLIVPSFAERTFDRIIQCLEARPFFPSPGKGRVAGFAARRSTD